MKKSLIIIGIVIIIVGGIFTGAWIWASGLKEDKAQTEAKMNKILKAYPNFNTAIDEFSNARNTFYEKKEDLYIESLAENTSAWNEFIDSYEDAIKKVEKAAKDLKKNCNTKYGDVSVSTKCTTFKANYEAANNYFISDIKMYNELIDEYDKYNEENKNKYDKADKGEFVVYKDYIDYDGDKEYFGKEEA